VKDKYEIRHWRATGITPLLEKNTRKEERKADLKGNFAFGSICEDNPKTWKSIPPNVELKELKHFD